MKDDDSHKDQHKIKHGIIHYIQTSGKIHPTQRKRIMLSKELDRLRDLLIAQTPDMNTKKEMLINDAVFCQGVMDLALLYINKVGLFEERQLNRSVLELQPIIKHLGQFMNIKRMNLLAVGLGSDADKALDVQAVIKQFDEDKEKKSKKEGGKE